MCGMQRLAMDIYVAKPCAKAIRRDWNCMLKSRAVHALLKLLHAGSMPVSASLLAENDGMLCRHATSCDWNDGCIDSTGNAIIELTRSGLHMWKTHMWKTHTQPWLFQKWMITQSEGIMGNHNYFYLFFQYHTLYTYREYELKGPSLCPRGIGARLRRNRLWVRVLAVSDKYHILCSLSLYDYSGPYRVRMGWYKNCVTKGAIWDVYRTISVATFQHVHTYSSHNDRYLDFLFLFFNTFFVSSHMYLENPEGTQVFVGSMNMGYISDTARNRTHNPFRPKCAPIPLGHSDGQMIMVKVI